MTPAPGEPFAVSLRRLPPAERREALQTMVIGEIKSALLMAEQDDVPLDANYFELGMSSLRVIGVKDRLQEEIGGGIDTSMFFNRPTVRQVVDYLIREPLSDLFAGADAQSPDEPTPDGERFAAALLDELYQV